MGHLASTCQGDREVMDSNSNFEPILRSNFSVFARNPKVVNSDPDKDRLPPRPKTVWKNLALFDIRRLIRITFQRHFRSSKVRLTHQEI